MAEQFVNMRAIRFVTLVISLTALAAAYKHYFIISLLLCAGCLLMLSISTILLLKGKSTETTENKAAAGSLVAALTVKERASLGRIDERHLEAGNIEVTAVSIDGQSQKFYQNLSNKAKQDAAADLLLKKAEENHRRDIFQERQQSHRQQRQKEQADRKLENQHQLKKLQNRKLRKKIAQKVERKNIRLNDEQIKKIKLRALQGKSR